MRQNRKIPIKVKNKWAFVVDGECESWYLSMLMRNEKSINADFTPEVPQKKKLKDQFERVIDLSKDYDKVFWIVDFDVIISESRMTRKGKETELQKFEMYYNRLKKIKNVVVIINNPCLEFWILIHFEQTGKYFNNCDEATKQLKTHLPDYEKTQKYYTKQGNDIYQKLSSKLQTAVTNSKKLTGFDFKNPNTGITQMQYLFESFEFEKFISIK